MKIWCVSREAEDPFAFDFEGEKPPPMLAIPQTVNGQQRLREYELLSDGDDEAVYLETPESAERVRLAA